MLTAAEDDGTQSANPPACDEEGYEVYKAAEELAGGGAGEEVKFSTLQSFVIRRGLTIPCIVRIGLSLPRVARCRL